jgi:protein SCO1/2
LFSISFDVATDSPQVLQDYARRYDYDPAHWNFLTGDLTEITAIADQFGAYFGPDGSGGISHNLRTVVVDAAGRVQKFWGSTDWSASDLAAELIKGAKAKP